MSQKTGHLKDKLDIIIEVEEKNTGEASLGAGYSSASSTILI